MTKKKLDERHRAQAVAANATAKTASAAGRTAQAIQSSAKSPKRAVKQAVKTAADMSMGGAAVKGAKKIASNPTVKKAARATADVMNPKSAVSAAKKVASNPTVKKAARSAASAATLGIVKAENPNRVRTAAKAKRTMTASEVRNSPAVKSAMKRVAATDGKALYEEMKKKSSKRGK